MTSFQPAWCLQAANVRPVHLQVKLNRHVSVTKLHVEPVKDYCARLAAMLEVEARLHAAPDIRACAATVADADLRVAFAECVDLVARTVQMTVWLC